ALVHPHLATTNGFIEMAFRHTFADAQQEIIQTLSGMFRAYLNNTNGRGTRFVGYCFALREKRHIIAAACGYWKTPKLRDAMDASPSGRKKAHCTVPFPVSGSRGRRCNPG